jgi:hypothetical protein
MTPPSLPPSSSFNQAMKEQKSHGVVMHGKKQPSLKIDN